MGGWNSSIRIDHENPADISDISVGTSAKYTFDLYLAKKKQIDDLQYECSLLVDKYHSEMQKAHIPFEFGETFLIEMFSKDKQRAKFTQSSRELFLERGFSKDFIVNHIIDFITYEVHGYSRTAIGVVLGIGDYRYTIQFPLPKNIYNNEDKKILMGEMKFRVDRIQKSKEADFVKSMESVCLPTYDWKECFEAIEQAVDGGKEQK